MKGVSLFSGCGGLDRGAYAAGVAISVAYEKDPLCEKAHSQLVPGCEFVAGPVQRVDGFGETDVVLAGYPCQSFSLGGARRPVGDPRSILYLQLVRCLDDANPEFFVAENVVGLRGLEGGRLLTEQLLAFSRAGRHGYAVAVRVVRAEEYGVPQRRRRIFIIGVRRDLKAHYWFPEPSHGPPSARSARRGLEPWTSHGDVLAGLPMWPAGDFYERPDDEDRGFGWYFMSRNRKARWDDPSFTVLANWRHTSVHPASPAMALSWSDLADGWKQRWEFSSEYEHLDHDPGRGVLPAPRRLSWRECARLQTLPDFLEPAGSSRLKMRQVGDAVPPALAAALLEPLINGERLRREPSSDAFLDGALPPGFMPKPRVRSQVRA